jgi:hypothetical protein
MEIVIYQLTIAGIIIIASIIKGRAGCNLASIIAVIWTLTHIFAPWLMAIQFVTIGISYLLGRSISSESES